MSPPPEKSSQPIPPRQKKIRRLRRLFFTLLTLTLFIGIAQGPGLRFAAEKGISKGLAAAGLEGTFIVDGSLFSGIQLRAVHLTGKGPLRELHIEKIAIEYKLSQLIYGKVDALVGDHINVWIDLDQQSPNKTEKPADADTEPSEVNLEKIRQMVLPIALNLTHSSVYLSRGDSALWHAKELSITHKTGAEDFHIFLGEFIDLDNNTIVNQDAVLTWEHNRATAANFPLHTQVAISEVICALDNITPTHIQVKTTWENSDFTINLDHLKKARIELTHGEIILDRLAPLLAQNGAAPDFGGEISELRITVPDIMAPPANMQAELSITGDQLRWQKRLVQRLHINASMKEARLEINTKLNVAEEQASAIKAIATLDTSNPATASDWATCWHNANAQIELSIHEPEKIVAWAGVSVPPGGWPTGSIHLFAKGQMNDADPGDAALQLEWITPHWAGLAPQDIRLTAKWDHLKQSATVNLKASHLADGSVSAYGKYSIKAQQYTGNFNIDSLDIAKLRPLLDLFKQPIPRAGIVNFSWDGSGTGNDLQTYQGNIDANITGLDAEPKGNPTTSIQLAAAYSKGLNLQIDTLEILRDKLQLKLQGKWLDNQVRVPLIELHDPQGVLAKASIQFPLTHHAHTLDTFRKQSGDIAISLNITQLPLAKIFSYLPNPPQLTGKLSTDLKIAGNLQKPNIEFTTQVKQLKLTSKDGLPETDINLKINTNNDTITLEGRVTPKGHQHFSLTGKLPFHPNQWIDTPNSLMNEPIQAQVDTHTVDLAPYASLVSIASSINGNLVIQTKVSGTIQNPNITSSAKIKLRELNFISEKLPDIRDLDIGLEFKDNLLTIKPSKAIAAGGKYSLVGNVNFKEFTNPIFNISLNSDKALILRDEKMIIRADAAIKLTGPYKKAKLSGNIGIVESLFYKDIEIIPLGGSSSAAQLPGRTALPSFTKPHVEGQSSSSIPLPFQDWTLDVRIKTKEDFLIRGNLASGTASANILISGTIGNPLPKGKATIKKLDASLPFSQIHIRDGLILFTPKTGFDPKLNLKATSRVGSTDVEITVFGNASSPQHLLSSSPPLPEEEIIFLLATGTTSEKLTSSGSTAATGKAFQLLLDTWLRSSPEKLKTLKKVVSLFNKTVNVNIGGTDQFTGKQFNSATIKIHDRWYVIASMDLENNTRGLLLYTIRFK